MIIIITITTTVNWKLPNDVVGDAVSSVAFSPQCGRGAGIRALKNRCHKIYPICESRKKKLSSLENDDEDYDKRQQRLRPSWGWGRKPSRASGRMSDTQTASW